MGYIPVIAFDILPPRNTLDIAVFAIDPVQDLGRRLVPAANGAELCVASWRKLAPETVPVEAKAAANYLNGMLARQDARKKGCDMAVMLDTRGFLGEGATESIFLVKDGRIMTPALAHVAASFGPPEYFTVALFGVVLVVMAFRSQLGRGIMLLGLGFWFSTVGIDGTTLSERYVFGTLVMQNGLDIVPICLGLFGIGQTLIPLLTAPYYSSILESSSDCFRVM
jgi:TctA family transporter